MNLTLEERANQIAERVARLTSEQQSLEQETRRADRASSWWKAMPLRRRQERIYREARQLADDIDALIQDEERENGRLNPRIVTNLRWLAAELRHRKTMAQVAARTGATDGY
jgi:hypothetical protein